MEQITTKVEELVAREVPALDLERLANKYEKKYGDLETERNTLPWWRVFKKDRIDREMQVLNWAILQLTFGTIARNNNLRRL